MSTERPTCTARPLVSWEGAAAMAALCRAAFSWSTASSPASRSASAAAASVAPLCRHTEAQQHVASAQLVNGAPATPHT